MKTGVFFAYFSQSGCFLYFSSSMGTPETYLNNNVIVIGLKMVMNHKLDEKAINQIPHQRSASPK